MDAKFSPATLFYAVDVPYGTQNITLRATAAEANAKVEGAGTKTLSSAINEYEITVTSEDDAFVETYTVTVYTAPEGLISVSDPNGTGKRIVNIHSYIGKASDSESPYKLLIGERRNTNGDQSNKWCENNNDVREPWVIFSLTDIYYIDHIEFRDGNLMSDGTNIDEYTILVSTTGTSEYDFEEVVYKSSVSGQDVKSAYIDEFARYIKFVPRKAETSHAVWIYGFDIYADLSQTQAIDRGDLISVGKTIVGDHNHWSDRETPANLVDGNVEWYNENTF
jgi:hypothetical protein